MSFSWDPHKNIKNLLKHGILFNQAATVFDDPDALIIDDLKHSTFLEKRKWILGKSDVGIILVIFTKRLQNTLRIISARKANRKERILYEKNKRV